MDVEINKNDISWKNKNEEYLKCIQRFLDRTDNIKEEKLKQSVIGAMLRCDEILTKLAEEEIKKAKHNG